MGYGCSDPGCLSSAATPDSAPAGTANIVGRASSEFPCKFLELGINSQKSVSSSLSGGGNALEKK
jgi:hypothetical protein